MVSGMSCFSYDVQTSEYTKKHQKLEDLKDVSKLILPGVGAFDYAMQRFNNSGLRTKAEQLVLGQKIPVLGVCVGMQMWKQF